MTRERLLEPASDERRKQAQQDVEVRLEQIRDGSDRFCCPNCGGDLYRGSHRGSSAYKCMSANRCELSNTPIGRTKAEVGRVCYYLRTDRYAYSKLTDTWYRVTEHDDLGDGKIVAKSKEPVDREDVPKQWLEATDERGEKS